MVIESETFRLLNQCLNRMLHRVSYFMDFKLKVNRSVMCTYNTQRARYTDPAEEPHGAPQTGHTNAEITPQSNYYRILLNPFQVVIHQSPYYRQCIT